MGPVAQPWTTPDTPSEPRRAPVTAPVGTAQAPVRGPLRGAPVERLQPRGVGAILDGGFEVLRFRFPLIVALTATVVTPLLGIPLLVRNLRLQDRVDAFSSVSVNLGVGPSTSGEVLSWGIQTLGGGVALALLGLGVGFLVTAWLRGDDPTYRDVMRLLARRGPLAVAAWVVALAPKALGLAACGIGVIFSVAMFVVLSPVLANEAVGPFAAIARSYRLSSGRRASSMVGLVLCGMLVQLAFSMLAFMIASVLESELLRQPSWGWIVVSAVQLAFSLLLYPLQAAWATLAYLDLRVRAEGLDIVLEGERLFPDGGGGDVR